MIDRALLTSAASWKGDPSGELDVEGDFHIHCLSLWTFQIFNSVNVLHGKNMKEGKVGGREGRKERERKKSEGGSFKLKK